MEKTDLNLVVLEVLDPKTGKAKVLEGRYPAGPSVVTHQRFRDFKRGDVVEVMLYVSGSMIKYESVQLRGSGPLVQDEWVKIGTEYFTPAEYLLFSTAMKVLEDTNLFVIQGKGPSQCGKSSRFGAWAKHVGMDLCEVNCASVRDMEEWFGYAEARDGSTVFDLTQFTERLEAGNVVMLLDEFNRVNPMLLNPLLPLFDFRGRTRVHGREIVTGPNVLLGLTLNEGLDYVATYVMDAAMRRRIGGTFVVTVPPPSVEKRIVMEKSGVEDKAAATIVRLLNKLRETNSAQMEVLNLSVGAGIKIGWLHNKGMSIRQAIEFVLINDAPVDLQREIITQVNAECGEGFTT